MKTEKIKFTIGLILISGLVIYSFATNFNFSQGSDLNNKLSASINEFNIDSNSQIKREDEDQFSFSNKLKIEESKDIKNNFNDEEINSFKKENPSNLSVKKWVSKDMAKKIIQSNKSERVKVGDKDLNQKELEEFFNNILDKKEKEQKEALSYLGYNSMRILYLENKDKSDGKQVIQLTSRKNNTIEENFYISHNSSVLVFNYVINYEENIEEYRNKIKETIRSIIDK